MRNLNGIIRSFICGAALFVCISSGHAQQMDPTDPWQHDRAAHQKNIEEQAKTYQDRWPEYYKERYEIDGVGVLDKKGARAAFDEKHAPVALNGDAADAESDAVEDADSDAANEADMNTDPSELSE